MKRFTALRPAAWLALLLAQWALASETRESTHRAQAITALERRSASAQVWGLTEQEWARFESLKAGPRGYWSPNLDPLTALGVEAETELERQRYAELQVRLEALRAERELAYQKAYDAAWARLYPGLLPVQALSGQPQASPLMPRLALFVEAGCPACVLKARQLHDAGRAFDLYWVDSQGVGSQGEDERLRAWARQAGITAAPVLRRRITLNHDRGQWRSLGVRGTLPASFTQVNGQWQRLD